MDRDFLQLNNLQRQVLYDEDDVAAGLPKAIAARNRLRKINSSVEIEAIFEIVDRRDVAQGAVQAFVVVLIHVLGDQSSGVFQAKRRPRPDALAFNRPVISFELPV